jgi:hypothetical protein
MRRRTCCSRILHLFLLQMYLYFECKYCYNTDTIKKNTEIPIDTSKEVRLYVNAEKTE